MKLVKDSRRKSELRVPTSKFSPVSIRKGQSDAQKVESFNRDVLNTSEVALSDHMSDYTDSESGVGANHSDYTDFSVGTAGTRCVTPDPSRHLHSVEVLERKIERAVRDIQEEQTVKSQHVEDFIELSKRAATDDTNRNIKLVFEKRNQSSTNTIAKLQKKLDRYQSDLKRLKQAGPASTQHRAGPREVKDTVIQGIKDFGGSVVGNFKTATDALVSKPKDYISKSKSGSADNINSLTHSEGHSIFYTGFADARVDVEVPVTNGHSLGRTSGLSRSADGHSRKGTPPTSPTGSTTLPANDDSPHSSRGFKLSPPSQSSDDPHLVDLGSASDSSAARESPQNSSLSAEQISSGPSRKMDSQLSEVLQQIRNISTELNGFRNRMMDIQEEVSLLRLAYDEERNTEKTERLEEHVNEFVELMQNEMSNIKQEITNMEEKIDYQLDERTRDLSEAIEGVTTRLAKIELQSQHQQLINMEGVNDANARVLLTKFINVLLACLAVVLVFISTVSTICGPFLNTRWKVLTMIILIAALVITSKNWDSIAPFFRDRLGIQHPTGT